MQYAQFESDYFQFISVDMIMFCRSAEFRLLMLLLNRVVEQG
jgi:hypothetical protein